MGLFAPQIHSSCWFSIGKQDLIEVCYNSGSKLQLVATLVLCRGRQLCQVQSLSAALKSFTRDLETVKSECRAPGRSVESCCWVTEKGV